MCNSIASIRRGLIALGCLALPWAPMFAATPECQQESAECAAVGRLNLSLGVGYGSRSNPVETQSDIPLIVVPKLSYYGKRFFLENLEFGVTIHESSWQSFSVIAAPGYDRVFFFRNDLQNFFVASGSAQSANPPPGPPTNPPAGSAQAAPTPAEEILAQDRDVTYLVGPEWNFDVGPFVGQLDALYEVTGKHGGTELRAAIAVPLIDATSRLTFSAGGTWKSSEIVTYYYGAPGIYEPGAAFNPFAKLSYSVPLGKHWELNAFAHIEWLDAAIETSPIIFEDRVTTAFAGVFYSF